MKRAFRILKSPDYWFLVGVFFLIFSILLMSFTAYAPSFNFVMGTILVLAIIVPFVYLYMNEGVS